MPADPISLFLLSIGVDPEALVFAVVMASITTLGVVLARAGATR